MGERGRGARTQFGRKEGSGGVAARGSPPLSFVRSTLALFALSRALFLALYFLIFILWKSSI